MTGSHVSLFAGAGMIDLAVEAAGFKTVATSEVDPFCQAILRKRFPDARHLGDVHDVKPSDLLVPHPLLISGGFPCQDVSSAGTGQGLRGTRSGLWDEFYRIVRRASPDYVLIENSPMLRSRGLDRILGDLFDGGYDARWDCIPAAAVGAPHIRDRIFVGAWYAPDSGVVNRRQPLGLACTAGVVADEPGPSRYVTSLPRAGRMLNGVVYEDEPRYPRGPARRKAVRWWGFTWPTPTRADGSGGPGTTPKREGGKNLRTAVNEWDGSGRLNPTWVEWLMGLPSGWTDLDVDNDALVPHTWDSQPQCGRTTQNGRATRSKRIRVLGNGAVPAAVSEALDLLLPLPMELSP